MKICYLGDAPSLHLRKFAGYFADQGNEIHIISMRPAKYDNATVHQMPMRIGVGDLDYLLNIFWLRKLLRALAPDVLHAHYLSSYGLLGALSGFHPLIVTAWGTDLLITPKKSFVFRSLLRYTLKQADTITDVAFFMNRQLVNFGADPSRIITSPMGVETKIFCNRARAFKKKHSTVLSMRSLIKNSNVDIIIKAMQILKKSQIRAKLLIGNSGRLEKDLRRLVADSELNDTIDFIGFVKHSKTLKYFTAADIYVSVTSSDGASVTLLEAMASGAFPIVSDIPANKEWIKDGENGFIVPPNDPYTLAEKMKLAIRDEKLREAASHVNWQIIKERATLQKSMRAIERQYQSLHTRKFAEPSRRGRVGS